METNDLFSEIKADLVTQRDRINTVLEALDATPTKQPAEHVKQRKLSASARKRISDAQIARWAKKRKAAKAEAKAAKTT